MALRAACQSFTLLLEVQVALERQSHLPLYDVSRIDVSKRNVLYRSLPSRARTVKMDGRSDSHCTCGVHSNRRSCVETKMYART